jgi:hypothetical protein
MIKTEIRSLLSLSAYNRTEARDLLKSAYFHTGPVSTLRVIESLLDLDPADQVKINST